MTFVPFQHASDIANRFIALLAKEQIVPPNSSQLQDELLSLTELLDIPVRSQIVTVSDEHKTGILRAGAGVHDFAAKVLSAVASGGLPRQFVPHLRMLATSPKFAALMGQNYSGGFGDDLGRKMIELYVACCVSHFASELELDDPENSKGDNPDVIFRPNLSGVAPNLWTIAIKTLGSAKGRTMFENIKRAGEQINADQCKAERGLVLLNARDVLDHDVLWKPKVPFPDLQTAKNALQLQLARLQEAFVKDLPHEEWLGAVGGKVRQPVLILGHTLVSLPGTEGRVATQLKGLATVDFVGESDQEALAIANALNDCVQTII